MQIPIDLNGFDGPRADLINYMDVALSRWLRGNPIWYIYGGQDITPGHGVDCSGFVIIGLQVAGILPPGFDDTAHGLWNRFKKESPHIAEATLRPGDLVFYGKNRVTHVGMLYTIGGNTWIMVEAAGGTRTTKTIQAAKERNAYVRPSYINRRSDLWGFGRVTS